MNQFDIPTSAQIGKLYAVALDYWQARGYDKATAYTKLREFIALRTQGQKQRVEELSEWECRTLIDDLMQKRRARFDELDRSRYDLDRSQPAWYAAIPRSHSPHFDAMVVELKAMVAA